MYKMGAETVRPNASLLAPIWQHISLNYFTLLTLLRKWCYYAIHIFTHKLYERI